MQPAATHLKPNTVAREFAIPVETPCFPVRRFDFDDQIPWYVWGLRHKVDEYIGQCLGQQGIQLLLTTLNDELIAQGYSTSKISVPAQNLQSGVLLLHLSIGRVSNIRMVQGTEEDTSWGTYKNAFPIAVGDPLNVHALEQGVEQMKRLPSQNVSTRIEPGEEAGSSVVLIERPVVTWRDRVRGGLTLDNSGSAILGRTQLSGYMQLDNPAGFNDLFTLSGSSNLIEPNPSHRSQSLSLSYSVPWGYSLLSLTYSHARFAQNVQGTTVTFLSSGESDTASARLQRTLWRSSAWKFGVYAQASLRQSNSFLNDVELVVQRQRTANFELGATYKHLIGAATVEAELGYRRGKPWWHAQQDLTATDPTAPTVRPHLWLFNASVNTPLRGAGPGSFPWNYSAALRVQQTRDKTLSIDQIGIGSRYTVRGFDGNSVLLAESGATLRQELVHPIAKPEGWLSGYDMSTYGALDIGHVWGASASGLAGTRLAGMAVGLRARKGALSFDVALGTPLYRPARFVTSVRNVYASLSYAI